MIWVETLINGALLGGLYALLGIGLALVFGVMRVVNIAHGEFMVLSAFCAVLLSNLFPQVSPLLMLIPVIALSFAVGWLYQAVIVNRVVTSPDPLSPLLLTFGVSVVLRNVMVEIFGADVRSLQVGELSRASLEIAGLNIGIMPLLTLVLAALLFMALQLVLRRTEFGRIVRATADRRDIVRLSGVKPDRVYNYVMGLSLALGAIGGVLLAVRSSFTPFSGAERLLIAFEVVVLGGLGSFWGALLGGIALGMAQLIGLKIDPNAGLLYAHLLFFIMLLIRPSGLVSSRV
ncbi:branched-chain amino acid transport system permease protein [Bradyrhizobium macuxiense]|uniref:Branched-chain amino acid transport system permease protein n=2 Tax=Pseudomonadota TaxID=1224 RepID=A0A560KZ35_9BRAD|nr:branched-chain amino acid ABC transporter permease [Bradyrhizobium macuxiense]TWB88422.1 branched-chain amino acid transport system permease protein [Bradyrhizobium macuxiense]